MKINKEILQIIYGAFLRRYPMSAHKVYFNGKSDDGTYCSHFFRVCVCCLEFYGNNRNTFWLMMSHEGCIRFWGMSQGASKPYAKFDEFIEDFAAEYPISGLEALLLAEMNDETNNTR